MSDYISALPSDNENMDGVQQQLFQMIVKPDAQTVMEKSKDFILAGFLFLLLNSQISEEFIMYTVRYARENKTSLLFVKTGIFIVLYFIFRNIHLASA